MQYSFILVEPEVPENLGAAARALNTMGHADLRLVRPRCDRNAEKAQVLAHGSQHILNAAPIYEHLAEALHDIELACATTARHRYEKYHYISARELPQYLQAKGGSVQRLAIIFGGERSGLNRQDINCCDLITTIPQEIAYPSLNLAQAVMVYSYVLADVQAAVQIQDQRLNRQPMPVEEYAHLKQSTLQLMGRIGLAERYQQYVTHSLALLGYEDLYLLHNIRACIDRTLDRLEVKHSGPDHAES
ncbi:TrmH family RNA methyltransferase [Acaryochloris sp. IP29b_bin.148]|uniref:TrmH family RNA methyltransferase n=1 Tax=Acaryochloris sp. IP29b_bin.148 TaxID=2969218 RepID=UPI002619CD9F|nr:TrmH family RNA methyltransferase [Acaryochloris sp. IP29b_bin.148]